MRNLALVLLCAVGLVQGGETLSGQQIIDRVRQVTTATDRRARATMTITDRNGRVQTRSLRMVMKGNEKLLMTFESPADLKGVSFLSTSPENMWIYLPAQGRVRRVAGAMVDQGLAGSDFSYGEMANISFADQGRVEDLKDTTVAGRAAWVVSTRDDDGVISRLAVDRDRFLPLELTRFDRAGKPSKRVQFGDFIQSGESWVPRLVTVRDLARGSRTELKLTDVQLNTGIKDNLFTEGNLKKGV